MTEIHFPDKIDKTVKLNKIINMLTKFNSRFGPIVQGLLMKSNEQLRTESLILINAIITQPDDLDFRMHLRNEFMRVGLLDVLDVSW